MAHTSQNTVLKPRVGGGGELCWKIATKKLEKIANTKLIQSHEEVCKIAIFLQQEDNKI